MQIDHSHQFLHTTGFMVLEGVNGAGKSTLLRKLLDEAALHNRELIETREPGGTSLGNKIRSLVLEDSDEQPHYLTELFLFAADRAEHVSRVIRPTCAEGKLVISDRYYYSTAAFQGYGRKLDLDTIHLVNQLAIQDTKPDLVILLDLDPKVGLKRKISSSAHVPEEEDKFEQEELEFHDRLRKGFLELAKNCTEPFFVVDASLSSQEVFEQIQPLFYKWLQSCTP